MRPQYDTGDGTEILALPLLRERGAGVRSQALKGCSSYSRRGVWCYIAYLRVHSRAVSSYLGLHKHGACCYTCAIHHKGDECAHTHRSVLYWCATSGTSGSSGFASVSSEQMESNTLEIVSAGLHWSFRISRQMPPLRPQAREQESEGTRTDTTSSAHNTGTQRRTSR